ncbi:TonB family protein [Daejeonella lutea]|uniref:TonB family C-terminal domain-containing protein n=1 Tax=Daejeonella lutea TaxID=572036 RepID=A0A1T5DUW9_9SPHI|nr:TonB family protein [Daejeonella lutea]SKB75300.1 TonB family C-terminal domain-containing protein [Daejeonella lutea]
MKTNYPDSLTIQQYLEGKLDPEVAHQLEKQALDDPFLWDALEGYSVYRDPAADLSILQRQLHERIVHLQENKKVFDLSWQRLSIAAAAAVMFVSAGILFWMNSHKAPEQLASEAHKPVEVNVIDRDSVEAVIQSKDQAVVASLEKKEIKSERPVISASKPGSAIDKKAVISPEVEGAIASKSAAASVTESQTRSVAATRQAKMSRVEENAAMNQATAPVNNAPKSGWAAYNHYLTVTASNFNTEPQVSGVVIISFQVGIDGKLNSLKVVKSLNEAYDKEALRIVRNGSEWTPSPEGKPYDARVEVNFPR